MALLVQEMNARSGAKSHRKSFKIEPGGIHKSLKIHFGAIGGVLGALGFMNAERRADKDEQWSHFGATWSIACAILARTGFRRADPLAVS